MVSFSILAVLNEIRVVKMDSWSSLTLAFSRSALIFDKSENEIMLHQNKKPGPKAYLFACLTA